MSNSFLNPVTTQTWANGRHIVRCVKVIQETWDVRTFCFMADQPIMFFFKPGQFVTLELEIDGLGITMTAVVRSPAEGLAMIEQWREKLLEAGWT